MNRIKRKTKTIQKKKGGSYMKITSQNFEKEVLQSDKPVIVDFYATWCGPCKMLAPIMEEIEQENTNIKVCKIDIDEDSNLAAQYNIMSVPTLIAIKNGQIVNTLVGLRDKQEILDMLK